MALPAIKSFQDCADYNQTIQPFIPQLYDLPNKLLANLGNLRGLEELYISTNPVISGFAFSCVLFPVFLIVSEINKNYSQVDRVWSILPTVYHAHYAVWARLNGLPTQRVDNVLAFSVCWTLRLTFNYWRRGGYQIGSEDYRWNLIKGWIGAPAFFLLNILFTSSLQSVLLFAITTPTYLLMLTSRLDPAMSLADTIFARFLIALVVFEWFADGQQWNYYQAKHQYQKTAKVPSGYTRAELDRGFNTVGLFRYSRHPNFAAEQSIWLVLHHWSCWATSTYINWTFAATASYLLIFQGSTPITEYVTSGKYPEYRLYQKRVGMFIPTLFSKGWDEAEAEKLAPQLAAEQKQKQQRKTE